MGIPVVVGWSEKFERNGESFRATCSACGRDAKMFRGRTKENVSAFFAISLWDGGVDAVQCGECLQIFEASDEKPAPSKRLPPPPAPARPKIDEREIDDELARLKAKLGKP
jgi:hypothetical protein